MQQYVTEVYGNNSIRSKLTEKYGANISFTDNMGLISITVLDMVKHLLADSKRVVLFAAKLIKNAIFSHENGTYK